MKQPRRAYQKLFRDDFGVEILSDVIVYVFQNVVYNVVRGADFLRFYRRVGVFKARYNYLYILFGYMFEFFFGKNRFAFFKVVE